MLKKRIIPCLDINNGRTVKGVNFVNIKDAGDPVELAKKYSADGADELVFLDISATVEKRKTLISLVEKVASQIDIPFTVGGGISSIEDVSALIGAGADKVSINSSAVKRPKLIEEIAQEFGSQCLIVAIDTKLVNDTWKVFVRGGRTETQHETLAWAKQVEELGAGEILLTSMSHDGTESGFAINLTQQVANQLRIPVIASGGAGKKDDFKNLFQETEATGGLAASIFHYNKIPIPELKNYLRNQQIPIR